MRLGEKVFELIIGGKPGDEKNKLGLLLFFAIGFVLLMLFALAVVGWTGSGANAGPLGDFFGGILNPVLSFLAFAGVLYSIHLQRIDLRETQRESQRQQFESTFFQMLAQQNRIVEAIDLRNSDKAETSKGRDCFESFVRDIEVRYRGMQASFQGNLRQEIAVEYRNFWLKRRQDLGHYFRFLYNFIRYVDEADLPRLPGDDTDPKIKYMRILRAQLSDYELVLIFYNSFGDHGAKFNTFVGRYNLLDNLQPELVRITDAIKLREGLGRVGPLPVRPAL